jgi:hypothetical protein
MWKKVDTKLMCCKRIFAGRMEGRIQKPVFNLAPRDEIGFPGVKLALTNG